MAGNKRYITGEFECGVAYTFTAYAYYLKDGVRQYAAESNTYTTAWIGTPQNVKAETNASGTTVKWNSAQGATNYIIKINGVESGRVSSGSTQYSDYSKNVAGTKYCCELISCYNGEERNTVRVNSMYLNKPAITKVDATESHTDVSWNSVAGAEKYIVYKNGSAEEYWSGNSISFKDNTANIAGQKCSYIVKAVAYIESEAFESVSDKVEDVYVETPEILEVKVTSEKAVIRWNAAKGAEKYKVYRTLTGECIGTTADCSFTDTGSKNPATEYGYYIVPVVSDNEITKAKSTVKGGMYIDAPTNCTINTDSINGTTISWNPVIGADGYYVQKDGSSAKSSVVTSNSITLAEEKDTTCGYSYYVFAVKDYNGQEISASTVVTSVAKLDKPVLTKPVISSVTMVSGKAVVKWNAVAEATSYTVICGDTVCGKVNDTTFTDQNTLAEGKQYSYYVTANGDGCESVKSDVKTLKTPVAIISATLKLATVEIKWTKPSYSFGKYIIERKAGSGEYTVIASNVAATATSYVDKSLKAGTTYSYRVRTDVSAAGRVKAVKISASPVVTTYNTSTGTVVKWTAVSGAKKYRLERRIGTGSYATISTGLTGTTYTDNVAKVAGTTYTYRVIVDGISIYGTSKLHTFVPTNTAKVTNAAKGVLVSWTRVSCATGYIIYRKAGSGSYVRLATITKGTTLSYTDTTAKSGVLYTYYTRPFRNNSDGSISYAPGSKSVKTLFVAVPTVKAVSAGASGTTVIWNKVSGVNGYRIYRKIGSGKYALIKTVSSSVSSYLDKGAKTNGTIYTYCIVGYRAYSGVTYKSATAGYKTNIYLTAPVIKSAVNNGTGKVTTTWSRNTKATGYIFRYFIGSKYKDITITSNATLARAITSIKKGSAVKVYVRAYKTVSGVKYYSAWSAGKALKTTR